MSKSTGKSVNGNESEILTLKFDALYLVIAKTKKGAINEAIYSIATVYGCSHDSIPGTRSIHGIVTSIINHAHEIPGCYDVYNDNILIAGGFKHKGYSLCAEEWFKYSKESKQKHNLYVVKVPIQIVVAVCYKTNYDDIMESILNGVLSDFFFDNIEMSDKNLHKIASIKTNLLSWVGPMEGVSLIAMHLGSKTFKVSNS